MVGRRDKDGPEGPRAPGWYPDPWSATGEGERYFDGKKWGSSEKPIGRHSTVAETPSRLRPPTKLRPRSKWRRWLRSRSPARGGSMNERLRRYGPLLAFILLVAVVWGIPRLRSHHNTSLSQFVTPTTLAPTRPPPGIEEAKPIGVPAPVPAGNGKYEVLNDQPGDPSTPVAWDPCRPIHYVINPAGAPPDGVAMIRSALARVHTATGFEFVDDGTTTETPSKDRLSYQPDRYSAGRFAPVLIAWSNENAFPSLAGYVAGVGSPQAEYADNNHLVYVTGQLVLDSQDTSIKSLPDRAVVRAIMLHELGHVIGLDHTSDTRQIMYSEAQFNVRDYGNGDLRGLAKLGTQACYPNL